jgi:ATPase subunit of ABC transporter with duplicated ATPase domains
MRITSINLSSETCVEIGLGFSDGIQMDKLGHLIGLFGKNGVGKTRLLKIIHKLLAESAISDKYLLAKCILQEEIVFDFKDDTVKNDIAYLIERRQDALLYAKYQEYQHRSESKNLNALQTKYNKIANKGEIRKSIDEINAYVKKHIVFLNHDSLIKLKDTIGKKTDNILNSEHFQNDNIHDFQEDILHYFYSLTDKDNTRFWGSLQKLFLHMTEKTIELIADDEKPEEGRKRDTSCFKNIKIANDLCKYADLSDGEKVLFALCLLLFYYEKDNKSPLSKSILIFDEPERNLHPDAVNRLLEVLKYRFVPDQIFIASHSIDALASLEYNEIFHVESDKSHKIQHTLDSLIHQLTGTVYNRTRQLYNSLVDWSYHNFILQCFSEPKVIDTVDKDDIQVQAFVARITKRAEKDEKLKILEIGAGSGRVYKSAKDSLLNCEFAVYEPNNSYRNELHKSGIKVYDKIEDAEEIDVVLFCNVLHEIPPAEWINLFKILINNLKNDGEFIFIERNVLTTGEHAHEYDFFVLGSKELSILFNINELSSLKITVQNSKISCVPIEKRLLNEVTLQSINNAIKELQANSLKSIEQIKKQINSKNEDNNKMKLGCELAFYSTQYINCTTYLIQYPCNVDRMN